MIAARWLTERLRFLRLLSRCSVSWRFSLFPRHSRGVLSRDRCSSNRARLFRFYRGRYTQPGRRPPAARSIPINEEKNTVGRRPQNGSPFTRSSPAVGRFGFVRRVHQPRLQQVNVRAYTCGEDLLHASAVTYVYVHEGRTNPRLASSRLVSSCNSHNEPATRVRYNASRLRETTIFTEPRNCSL